MQEPFINHFWGTFLGAFFAYVFGLVTYVVKKIWDRENDGYNALVKLELYYMECVNVNSDNLLFIKTITPFIDGAIAATTRQQSPIPIIFPRKLTLLPIEKEYSFKLCNLKMANESYAFNVKIGRLNSDLNAANDFLHEINSCAKDEAISSNEYIQSLTIYKQHLSQIQQFSSNLVKEESIRLKAFAMVLMKDKPFLPSIIIETITTGALLRDGSYDFEKEIKESVEKIKKDMEDATKKYQEQLEAVFNTPTTNQT